MRVEGPDYPKDVAISWVGDIPERWAGERPHRAAIVVPESGRSISFSELHRNTQGFVALCEARGLKPGDRVAYLGRNSDLFFPVLFGCIIGGFVILPLNWRCTAHELAYMIGDAQARMLITDTEFRAVADKALELAREEGLPPPVIIEGEGTQGGLRNLISDWSGTARRADHDADQIVMHIYTSGTTGRPKGVMITHGGFTYARHSELTSPDWADWDDQDVILSPLPNFHNGGLSWVQIGLIRGLTCVLTADASPANLVRLIESYNVTRTFMVPTVVKAIIDMLKATNTPAPRIKTITYGAAVMTEAQLREAIAVFGCQYGQYYGMTETAGTVVYLPPADHDPERPHLLRSVGRPQTGMAIEIRNEAGQVVDPHTPGEIWVRTPTLMQGYWRAEEATKAAVVDGWYRTGDGGYVDEEGYLYLTDRIRDMIISGGENIYPAEVEATLKLYPSVGDVAVVGVPDEHWGEIVVAVVEVRPDQTLDADALSEFARERLARFKCPREVRIVPALPRTALGKVQRALVRAEAARIATETSAV